MRWESRTYEVVKVKHAFLPTQPWWVVSRDLTDPSHWVVINEFATAQAAYEYIAEVTARNRELA